MLEADQMILVRVGIYDVIQGDYLFCNKKWPYHGPACVEVASIKTTSVYEKPDGMRRFDQHGIARAHIDIIDAQLLVGEAVVTGNACRDKANGQNDCEQGKPDNFIFDK